MATISIAPGFPFSRALARIFSSTSEADSQTVSRRHEFPCVAAATEATTTPDVVALPLTWAKAGIAALRHACSCAVSLVRERVVDVVRERVAAEDAAAAEPLAMRGTPEIYFAKAIDNSRLVRVTDPRRSREMMQFAAACAVLFLFAMLYAWQHFSSIEYGYRIESVRAQISGQEEARGELQLEQAALRNPERIDVLARKMGMITPEVGRFAGLEPGAPEHAAPEMAQAILPSVTAAP